MKIAERSRTDVSETLSSMIDGICGTIRENVTIPVLPQTPREAPPLSNSQREGIGRVRDSARSDREL